MFEAKTLKCKLWINMGEMPEDDSIRGWSRKWVQTYIKNNIQDYTRKDTGIIMDATEITTEIGDIGYTGSIAVDVTFLATTFLPKENMTIESTAVKILPTGILFTYKGLMNIFVRDNDMKPYYYNNDCSIYEKAEDPSVKITNGSSVTVQIKQVRYENKKYSCIGIIPNDS